MLGDKQLLQLPCVLRRADLFQVLVEDRQRVIPQVNDRDFSPGLFCRLAAIRTRSSSYES